MTKPDWKKAPPWANFIAMDESGAWYYFNEQPACVRELGMFTAGSGRVESAKFPGWDASLEARPGSGATVRGVVLTDDAHQLGPLAQWHEAGWTNEGLVEAGHARWAP